MTFEIELSVAFNIVMTIVLILALVRGGKPERLGVMINLSGFVATITLRLVAPAVNWAPGAVGILAIDVVVAGGFFWLGVTTIRFWPIWAAVSVRPKPCRSLGGPGSFRVELSGIPTAGHDLLALVV